MSGAVSQWLVRATDDRVVTASNPNVAASILGAMAWAVRLPHTFGDIISRLIGPFYMVSMTEDVNIVHKYRFSQ